MEVKDDMELMALLRSIMEAKFGDARSEGEIAASPYLANVANRIVDALVQSEKASGVYSAAKWASWREVNPTRREWSILLERIDSTPKWKTWLPAERARYLECLASPLTISSGDRDVLLSHDSEQRKSALATN